MKHRFGWLAAACILAAPVMAQTPATPEADGKWHNSIGTYLWLTAIQGDAIIRGNPMDLDFSVGDAVDSMSNLHGAFALFYEGGKGPFSIAGDLYYIDLENSKDTDSARVTASNQTTIGELAGLYHFNLKPMGNGGRQIVSALAGVRYAEMGGGLKVEADGSTEKFDSSQSWTDFIIGGRYLLEPSEDWVLTLRGDVGGFGISGSSDLSYQLSADAGWKFSKGWAAHFGWRHIHFDYDHGSGSEQFKFNAAVTGPFTGITYSF